MHNCATARDWLGEAKPSLPSFSTQKATTREQKRGNKMHSTHTAGKLRRLSRWRSKIGQDRETDHMPTNACTAILLSAKRRDFIGQHPTTVDMYSPKNDQVYGKQTTYQAQVENTASWGNYAGDLADIQYTYRPCGQTCRHPAGAWAEPTTQKKNTKYKIHYTKKRLTARQKKLEKKRRQTE